MVMFEIYIVWMELIMLNDSAGPRGRPPCATPRAQAQVCIVYVQYGYRPAGLGDRNLRRPRAKR